MKDIAIAPGSPGEQGVSKSCTITLGFEGDGPETCLKWVAVCTLRIGCIKASRTTIEMSYPENPSVFSARVCKQKKTLKRKEIKA